jgi:rhodanese-related sulfurtransferase
LTSFKNSDNRLNKIITEKTCQVLQNKKTKGHSMQTTMSRIHAPEKAKAYFEDKLAFSTGPVELDRWIKSREDNLVVVDVRAAEDFAKGHIPGAVNIPKGQWGNPRGLSTDKTNVIYCYNQPCHLAANACVQFAGKGYPVMELEGGFAAWKENDLDIEQESINRLKQQSREDLATRR